MHVKFPFPVMPASFFRRKVGQYTGWALSMLFIAGCASSEKKQDRRAPSGPQALVAEAVVVTPAALQSVYQSSGTLLANESVQVYPETPGRITDIRFREGTAVRKGDLLVQLYDQDIRAQIQKLKVQRQLQVTTRERQDELLAINGISRQEFDNTVAQIASIDADIAYNEAQLRRLQIRAPFDGVIGLRNVSVGAIVSANTLITTIQQIDPLKLDFPVPEQYKGAVRNGDRVRFTVTGINDTLTGSLIAIQPEADATTHTIMLRARVPNAGRRLVPGAFANVFMTFGGNTEAITIPSQCVIPTTREKKVAVVRNGKAEMVTVTTGMRMAETVEILRGLQPGDTVLTTGIMQVKQGMDVRVSKIAAQ